ncbi:MAG: hypothetical protein AVDCRST_MAG01-01-1868, partial [uncultured Rubrobacteraceae bacterium]
GASLPAGATVTSLGGEDSGGARGIQASWGDGSHGLRVVPRLHDVRPGGGRGGIQRARRPLYRGRGQLYRHGRR